MKSFTVLESFSTIAPIIITIGIGYILGRLKFLGGEFAAEANKLNYVIGFPLLLFCSTAAADIRSLFDPKLVIYSVLSILVMAAAGYYRIFHSDYFCRTIDLNKRRAVIGCV